MVEMGEGIFGFKDNFIQDYSRINFLIIQKYHFDISKCVCK